jgi:hypothetical protein
VTTNPKSPDETSNGYVAPPPAVSPFERKVRAATKPIDRNEESFPSWLVTDREEDDDDVDHEIPLIDLPHDMYLLHKHISNGGNNYVE